MPQKKIITYAKLFAKAGNNRLICPTNKINQANHDYSLIYKRIFQIVLKLRVKKREI